MIKYIAFLRAINVGGRKLIKMEELRGVFARAGFKNVKTYIQSGNVIFDAAETNTNSLVEKIEKMLHKAFGHDVTVILRTMAELEDILRRNPFKKIKPDAEVVMFVAFLSAEPPTKPRLPIIAATENLEVLAIRDRAVFILCRRKKNGSFGFPNNLLEKELGVSATTRNWTTVGKTVDLAHQAATS